MVYLIELETDLDIDNDPVSFSKAINDDNSNKQLDTMKEEFKLMKYNCIWDLVELPKKQNKFRCKCVFKTKNVSHGTIKDYKNRLIVKSFTQKNGN